MGSPGLNHCSNCKDKLSWLPTAQPGTGRAMLGCAGGSGAVAGARGWARGRLPGAASPCRAGSSLPGKNSREVLQSVGHFSLSPLGMSGCRVAPCRRIYQPCKEQIWKKITFSPAQIPLSCPSPARGFLPKSSAWPKGGEEAQGNEEVTKYPWAVRDKEFWPISTDMLVGFVGIGEMMNLKLRQCLG